MLAAYLKHLFELGRRGDAREETFYPALDALLRAHAANAGRANIHVTILPKKTEGGNPDFRVWDGTSRIVGYIEAKAPTVAHLDEIEATPQFKRYLAVFPNVMLTNYYEFRLYRNGELADSVQVARPFAAKSLKMMPPAEHEAEFANLLAQFFSFSFPAIKDAGALAKAIALCTRFLTEVVKDDLAEDTARGKGGILGFFDAFKEYLISDTEPADFAGGTQTFNAMATRNAVEEFCHTHGGAGKEQFIRGHILEHFYSFELLMAPYAIGHMKMNFLLDELGYALGDRERMRIYLTNTLEMAEMKQSSLPGLSALSEEAHLAGLVKRETPVLVIHGNPPYSGISANMNDWIVNLLKNDTDGAQSYYTVDCAPLGERNPKWLQDDYVKFIRFAQSKIQQRGEGIVGIVTSRDGLVVDFDKDALERRMAMLRDKALSDDLIRETYRLADTGGWSLSNARTALTQDKQWQTRFACILYRPFDMRDVFYAPYFIERGRQDVMRHMLQPNLSLCFMRQVSSGEAFSHVLVSQHVVDNRTFFSSKGIVQQAPLYLYNEQPAEPARKGAGAAQVLMLFEPEAHYATWKGRTVNVAPRIWKTLLDAYSKKLTPESLFSYIYAILHANAYREKYAEFLKVEFPRVPLAKDADLFAKVAKLGDELVALHLLKSKECGRQSAKFQGKGDCKVEKAGFNPASGRVQVNQAQFFENVAEDVWRFHVGGYQVCEKWLKDRKGRVLSLDDANHYSRIVSAVAGTIEVQREVDALYPAVEKDVVDV